MEQDLAALDLAWGGHNAHNRVRGHALAAPALADDPQRPTSLDCEVHAVYGTNDPLGQVKVGAQILEFY